MPMLLNKFPIDKSKFNSPSIVSETQFWKNWDEFTQGKFKNLNWNNLFCAGGSILGCVDMSGMKGSDIDLFIYGCSVEEANNKVTYLVEYFKQIHENGILLQTKNSISLIFSYPTRNVQIILRLYHSPAEILLGFDIDSCAIGFDGKNVWTMERCIRALNKRYNLVNPSRRSTTYEYRLYKYSKRGFSVCVPSLNGSRVNINLFSKSIWQVQGLAKLLLYHRGFFSHQFLLGRKYLQRQTNSEREAIEETFIKRKGNFGIHDSEEDYSEFSLPYGPSWTNLSSYTKFLNSAKYANSSEALRRKIKFGDLNGLQIEQIEWLQQNPGQQNFIDENELLTGSFHPLSSKLWEQDVY